MGSLLVLYYTFLSRDTVHSGSIWLQNDLPTVSAFTVADVEMCSALPTI